MILNIIDLPHFSHTKLRNKRAILNSNYSEGINFSLAGTEMRLAIGFTYQKVELGCLLGLKQKVESLFKDTPSINPKIISVKSLGQLFLLKIE